MRAMVARRLAAALHRPPPPPTLPFILLRQDDSVSSSVPSPPPSPPPTAPGLASCPSFPPPGAAGVESHPPFSHASRHLLLPLSPLPCSLRHYSSFAVAAAIAVDKISSGGLGIVEKAVAATDSFPPVAAVQTLIDSVHSFTGLNWWACIAITTLMIRILMLPLMINLRKTSVKMMIIGGELRPLHQELENAFTYPSQDDCIRKMDEIYAKHGESRAGFNGGILIKRGFVRATFLSFFFAFNYRTRAYGGLSQIYNQNIFRGVALVAIPVTAFFPKAIFLFLWPWSMCNLLQRFVFGRPAVRKFLNIPELPATAMAAVQSLTEGSRSPELERKVSLASNPFAVRSLIRDLQRAAKAAEKSRMERSDGEDTKFS